MNMRENGIIEDLVKGLEYEIIAKKWEVSEGYVQTIASKYRNLGYDIPKQGSRQFKTINFMTYEQV